MARKLRADGMSVREIERHVGVARSSVSNWVRDVELTPEQRAELASRNGRTPGQLAGARKKSARFRALRVDYQDYSQKKRQNKLPYGTCRLALHRTHVVQAIYGGIQEIAGFERPEWLD